MQRCLAGSRPESYSPPLPCPGKALQSRQALEPHNFRPRPMELFALTGSLTRPCEVSCAADVAAGSRAKSVPHGRNSCLFGPASLPAHPEFENGGVAVLFRGCCIDKGTYTKLHGGGDGRLAHFDAGVFLSFRGKTRRFFSSFATSHVELHPPSWKLEGYPLPKSSPLGS